MYPIHADAVTTAPVGDERLLLQSRSGRLHQLNSTANFIWSLCDGAHSEEAIAAAMAIRYGISPAEAERDVAWVLQELSRLQLLRAEPVQAGRPLLGVG